jgi:hypothetical protein
MIKTQSIEFLSYSRDSYFLKNQIEYDQSYQFFNNKKLANELQLTAKSSDYKDIQLMSFSNPEKRLGNLRVTRLQNESSSKELWFYELTWSELPVLKKPY